VSPAHHKTHNLIAEWPWSCCGVKGDGLQDTKRPGTVSAFHRMSEHVKTRAQNPHMAETAPGVWVGSLASLSHLDRSQDWTVISILSSERLINLARYMISHVGVKHHVVWKLEDSPKADLLSEEHLSKVFSLLDSGETSCLVHCARGVSRSVAVCAAWMLSRQRCATVEQALQTIRRVRPEASPNLGFLACLRALEQCHGNIAKARERLSVR
jgi:protein-tyrosine phosphatase